MAGVFAGVQAGVQTQLGSVALSSAFTGNQQQNPSNTTTAVNLLIVVNGIAQGLIQSLRINESFSVMPVKAIGSAVDVAKIPGVYQASGTIDRMFIFGQTMEQSFGGSIRAVVGKNQLTPDFTQLYFNIVEVDNQGNALATRHDCMLNSISRVYDINGVIIGENADIAIRWSD